MRVLLTLSCLLLWSAFAGCDMRSDTAKSEMEKFSGTPTPTISPVPTEPPIDPADVVKVDIDQKGEAVSVNGDDQKKSVSCKKFSDAEINGYRNVITIKGPCRQIIINGESNRVYIDAAMTIMVNGDTNTIIYSRYVNGKRPIIKDNASGNSFEKSAAPIVPKADL